MYKLAILLFCLITYNSQSLMDTYELKFANKDATYTLQIKEGGLVFDSQPNVFIIAYGGEGHTADTDKPPFGSTEESLNVSGKMYKITKGATFEEGLKIGESDVVDGDYRIGESDVVIGIDREINPLLLEVDYQAYEIVLSYDLVTVVEKSSKFERAFPLSEDGVYLHIGGDKFSLFK